MTAEELQNLKNGDKITPNKEVKDGAGNVIKPGDEFEIFDLAEHREFLKAHPVQVESEKIKILPICFFSNGRSKWIENNMEIVK